MRKDPTKTCIADKSKQKKCHNIKQGRQVVIAEISPHVWKMYVGSKNKTKTIHICVDIYPKGQNST